MNATIMPVGMAEHVMMESTSTPVTASQDSEDHDVKQVDCMNNSKIDVTKCIDYTEFNQQFIVKKVVNIDCSHFGFLIINIVLTYQFDVNNICC